MGSLSAFYPSVLDRLPSYIFFFLFICFLPFAGCTYLFRYGWRHPRSSSCSLSRLASKELPVIAFLFLFLWYPIRTPLSRESARHKSPVHYYNSISNDCISRIVQTAGKSYRQSKRSGPSSASWWRSNDWLDPAGPAVNGHASNIPQRHEQQHQAGLGGRGSNRSKVTTHNDLATGHSLPHSLRRRKRGRKRHSFIRLEPRPAPSHSSNINSQVIIVELGQASLTLAPNI